MADQQDTFGGFVRKALGHKVGFVADLLGAIGFYGLVWGLLKLIAPDPLLNVPLWMWTAAIGTVFVFITVLLTVMSVGEDRQQRINGLVGELGETRKQLFHAEKAIEERPYRLMQQRAVEAASLVYGFRLEKRRHHYTVYGTEHQDNGSAICGYEMHFLCNRRSLGSWVRTASSTLPTDGFPQARNARMKPPFTVSVEYRDSSSAGLKSKVEEFKFAPTITAKDGTVPLFFEDSLPNGTFLTRRPNASNRPFDFVAVSPREPIALLEIEVTFDGFEPLKVWCNAVYGPAEQELRRESVDAEEALNFSRPKSHFVATLSLPYPVMGVEYRIYWELPEQVTLAPSPALAAHSAK